MSVHISAIYHFTIGCAPDDLPVLPDFYPGTLGLEEGYRPALRNPGHWLYAGGQAVVHLNALLKASPSRDDGPLDHIAFKAYGLVTTQEAFRAAMFSSVKHR